MVRSKPPALFSVAPPLATANAGRMELFTYREVAKELRVEVVTVYKWVRSGRVPSPIYTNSTARFTRGMIDLMHMGRKAPGSYPVADSPRAAIGKLGGRPKPKPKPKRKKPALSIADSVTTTRKRPPSITLDGSTLRAKGFKKPTSSTSLVSPKRKSVRA